MTAVKNITSYVKENLVKFMLLLVCLTLCLAMRYAALGKYVSILEESSQAVAGEFFFTSNYLSKELRELPFEIANWERTGDYITFDLKNYSNSLKFNETNQDIYFYVESDYFSNAACTEKATLKTDYDIELTTHFGEKDETETYYPDEIGTIEVDGKNYVVGKIEGGSTKSKTIYTKIQSGIADADGKVKKIVDTVYVKFVAHCIPISQLKDIELYTSNTNTTSGTKFSGSSAVEGVFNSDLQAVFMMGSSSSIATVSMDYDEEDGSQRLWIKLSCTYLENQGVADIDLYYDIAKVKPVEGMYTVQTIADYEAQLASDAAFKESHPYPNYLRTQLNSGGTDTIFFLKEFVGSCDETEVIMKEVIKQN